MPTAPALPPRHRTFRCVLLGIILGAAFAATIAWRRPDRFQSQARIAATFRFDDKHREALGSAPISEEFLVLAQTRVIHERVREKLQASSDTTLDSPFNSLGTEARLQNRLLLLSVNSTNYSLARDYVTAWASELVEFAAAQRRGARSTALAEIEQGILALERELERRQQELATFRRENPPGADRQTAATELERQRVRLETERLALQELAPELAEPGAGKLLELRLEQRRLAHRLAHLPAGTPDATRTEMETELKVGEADTASLLRLLEEAKQVRLTALDAQHRALSRRLEELRQEDPDAVRRNRQEYLEAEARAAKDQLAVLARQRLTTLSYVGESEPYMVVDAGTGPQVPVGPNRPKIIAQGALIGALVGLLVRVGLALRPRPATA